MTNKDTMPKVLWVYEDYLENGDGAKYTRLSPDEFIVNRKELEGMKQEKLKAFDQGFLAVHNEGFNAAIDKILEMGNE